MKKYNYVLIFLLSMTVIGLEITWTRIFSAEFFYTFAFLILSISILGLGLGGLAVRLWPRLTGSVAQSLCLAMTGLTAIIGPPVVFYLAIDFSALFSSWEQISKLIITIFILSSSFFFAGIILSTIFRENSKQMSRIYMYDLIGAALGGFLSILLMNIIGTPFAISYIVVPLMLFGAFASPGLFRIIPAVCIAVAIYAGAVSGDTLKVDKPERAPVIYTHWDAMSKLKVLEFNDKYRGLVIDNIANSPVLGFDGNWDRPDSLKYQFNIAFETLVQRFDSCCFMSLGAGGGSDVMQALQSGATEIHAVEVNPHINYMMREGFLKEFSGSIYNDPRVKVITEDARAYARKFEGKFDLIFSLSSNTWAALASGSFALAENYLFTKEAYIDYWNALSDDGFLMMEHQFYMPRIVGAVMEALQELEVKDYKQHFAVYNLPQLRRRVILISKKPLTDDIRYNAIYELRPEHFNYIHLAYPAADSLKDNIINQIVENGWEAVADSAKVNIEPTTDNRPFIAQMGLWSNLSSETMEKVLPYEFMGFPLSKLIMLIILAVALLIVLPLNLLPFIKRGPRLRFRSLLYFMAIGMGYMMVEVILIQKYTLLIGPSVYSFAVILMSLLLASGIGSRYSEKFSNWSIFGAIAILLLLDILVWGNLFHTLGQLPQFGRMIVTVILVGPLGFFMGMPFPRAARQAGELTDWGFAVNGAASVLGSVFIVLFAISFGYTISLLLAAIVYIVAGLLFSKTEWISIK